jgi:hypothetical protein
VNLRGIDASLENAGDVSRMMPSLASLGKTSRCLDRASTEATVMATFRDSSLCSSIPGACSLWGFTVQLGMTAQTWPRDGNSQLGILPAHSVTFRMERTFVNREPAAYATK